MDAAISEKVMYTLTNKQPNFFTDTVLSYFQRLAKHTETQVNQYQLSIYTGVSHVSEAQQVLCESATQTMGISSSEGTKSNSISTYASDGSRNYQATNGPQLVTLCVF